MRIRNATCLFLGVVLAACGNDSAEDTGNVVPLTAATLGQQTILPASGYLESAAYAAADPERGRQQAFACRACHTLEPGGTHRIGPNLHGIFGTTAGTREGFDYSKAIRDANFVWTPRALDAWLTEPGRFLPGNRMSFNGVSSEGDRRDLIAYLLVATGTDKQKK